MLSFSELDWRGLSPKLWGGFAPPVGGQFNSTQSGNPSFGFFDDFVDFTPNLAYNGYYIVETGDGKVNRSTSNYDNSTAAQKLATHLGGCELFTTTDNDEAIIAWSGDAAEGQFKLDNSVGYGDLVFECRLLVASDALVADHIALFAGITEVGGQATTKAFDGAQAAASTHDQLGFIKLLADSTGVDSYCKNQATADQGTVDVATLVASQFIKLGFRWDCVTDRVHYYVDGVEKTSFMIDKRVKNAALADCFPDDNYMTPIIAMAGKDAADLTVTVDWWACAQYLS